MKFSASRETILKPLQTVVGVVERRQTMPILSNVLLSAQDGKLHEICRALPDGANLEISLSGERLTVKAGRSRFTLSTLRAADFPTVEELAAKQTLRISRQDLRKLVDKTHFSMAQQDVRYYLNGLLLETERK